MELFGRELVNVHIKGVSEAFLLHPVSTVAEEVNLSSAHSFDILDDLRPNEISLARVCQDANGSDIRC